MQIAPVIGSTIATVKHEAIHGRKLLIVRKADTARNMTGDPFVAVDLVSAGSSARFTGQTDNTPLDGEVTYGKE